MAYSLSQWLYHRKYVSARLFHKCRWKRKLFEFWTQWCRKRLCSRSKQVNICLIHPLLQPFSTASAGGAKHLSLVELRAFFLFLFLNSSAGKVDVFGSAFISVYIISVLEGKALKNLCSEASMCSSVFPEANRSQEPSCCCCKKKKKMMSFYVNMQSYFINLWFNYTHTCSGLFRLLWGSW